MSPPGSQQSELRQAYGRYPGQGREVKCQGREVKSTKHRQADSDAERRTAYHQDRAKRSHGRNGVVPIDLIDDDFRKVV